MRHQGVSKKAIGKSPMEVAIIDCAELHDLFVVVVIEGDPASMVMKARARKGGTLVTLRRSDGESWVGGLVVDAGPGWFHVNVAALDELVLESVSTGASTILCEHSGS